ncbi:MAG: FAD-dependent oxidoreductase [Polyangiaceae bacterium]
MTSRTTRAFPSSVTGHELMGRFREQAEHQGTQLITADVQKVDFSERPFKVWVGEDENVLHLADTVIISTGARANYLGLDSEHALKNKGVSACAVCDGALYRGKDVVVVGGGDTAMEEASYLSGLCSKVTLGAPSRRLPRLQVDAGPRSQEQEDQDPLQSRHHRRARSVEGLQ